MEGGGKRILFFSDSLSLSFSRRNTPRWSVFSTPFEQSRVGHSEARSVPFMRKFALGATTLGAIPLFLKLFPPTVPRDDIRLPIPFANRHPSVDPCSRVVERIQLDCSANTHPYCYARILRTISFLLPLLSRKLLEIKKVSTIQVEYFSTNWYTIISFYF